MCHKIFQFSDCPHQVVLCEEICIVCDALCFFFFFFNLTDLTLKAYGYLKIFFFSNLSSSIAGGSLPPTSKKLEGHIASGLFVCPSVSPSVRLFVMLFDA